jgi:hypothetical protein
VRPDPFQLCFEVSLDGTGSRESCRTCPAAPAESPTARLEGGQLGHYLAATTGVLTSSARFKGVTHVKIMSTCSIVL